MSAITDIERRAWDRAIDIAEGFAAGRADAAYARDEIAGMLRAARDADIDRPLVERLQNDAAYLEPDCAFPDIAANIREAIAFINAVRGSALAPKHALPKITIEKVDRGTNYPPNYRAHIIGGAFDHHGEAETPQLALLRAAAHWEGRP